MKKAHMAALCSGLVIPGLGQILNEELKKGLLMLGAVLALFIAATVKLFRMVSHALESGRQIEASPLDLITRLKGEDFTLLWAILALSVILWIWSLVDAYVVGARLDRSSQGQ